jgi:hypothetical protein
MIHNIDQSRRKIFIRFHQSWRNDKELFKFDKIFDCPRQKCGRATGLSDVSKFISQAGCRAVLGRGEETLPMPVFGQSDASQYRQS